MLWPVNVAVPTLLVITIALTTAVAGLGQVKPDEIADSVTLVRLNMNMGGAAGDRDKDIGEWRRQAKITFRDIDNHVGKGIAPACKARPHASTKLITRMNGIFRMFLSFIFQVF